MPSTITTYHTFSPATKARSSQVNTNFDNYRGTLLPINDNTASASNGVHDLGSTDHRWLNLYGTNIRYPTSTTTVSILTKSNTSSTLGSYVVEVNSTSIVEVTPTEVNVLTGQLSLVGSTTTVKSTFKTNTSLTTGGLDLLFGANTIATFYTGGLQRRSLDVGPYTTTQAPIGAYVFSGLTTVTNLGSLSTTGRTLTVNRISARGGGLMEIKIVNGLLNRANEANTSIFSIDLYRGLTTTALSIIYTYTFATGEATGGTTTASQFGNPNFTYVDTSYTAGESVYQTIIRAEAQNAGGSDYSCTAAMFIKEI